MGEKKLEIAGPLFIEDIIQMSGCSERFIRGEIANGNLKSYKPGKRLQFKIDDYEKWFSRKRTK